MIIKERKFKHAFHDGLRKSFYEENKNAITKKIWEDKLIYFKNYLKYENNKLRFNWEKIVNKIIKNTNYEILPNGAFKELTIVFYHFKMGNYKNLDEDDFRYFGKCFGDLLIENINSLSKHKQRICAITNQKDINTFMKEFKKVFLKRVNDEIGDYLFNTYLYKIKKHIVIYNTESNVYNLFQEKYKIYAINVWALLKEFKEKKYGYVPWNDLLITLNQWRYPFDEDESFKKVGEYLADRLYIELVFKNYIKGDGGGYNGFY